MKPDKIYHDHEERKKEIVTQQDSDKTRKTNKQEEQILSHFYCNCFVSEFVFMTKCSRRSSKQHIFILLTGLFIMSTQLQDVWHHSARCVPPLVLAESLQPADDMLPGACQRLTF